MAHPYGIRATAKLNLHIDASITSQDTVIDGYIEDADSFIDSKLTVFGVTVPLTTIPQDIKNLSTRLAGEWYIHWNSPSHPMQGVHDVKKEIEEYVKAAYGAQSDELATSLLSKTTGGVIIGDETGTGDVI